MATLTKLWLIIALLSSVALGQGVSIAGHTSITGHAQVVVTPTVTGCNSHYTFWRQILLRKASGGDVSNFLYPLYITNTALKVSGSGGQVQHTVTSPKGVTVPADLTFCTANASGTPLKYFVTAYDGTNGILSVRVLIPTLTAASNTSIYLGTNNSAVATDQEDFTACSGASILSLWPFGDGSTLDLKDYCGSHNLTNSGGTAYVGLFGGGISFDKASSQSASSSLVTLGVTNITLETMIDYDGVTNSSCVLGNVGSGTGVCTGIINSACGPTQGTNTVFVGIGCGAAGANGYFYGPTPHYQGWAAAGGGSNVTYADGVTVGTYPSSPNTPATGTYFATDATGTNHATVKISEAREYSIDVGANYADTMGALTFAVNRYQWVEPAPSYTQPTLAQTARSTGCTAGNGSGSGTISCSLPFDVNTDGSGSVILLTAQGVGTDCGNLTDLPITSSLGLTYSLIDESTSSGHLNNYYNCLWAATVGSSTTGAETVSTTGVSDVSIMLEEWKKITVTGAVTAHTTNQDQPFSISATSPGANSLMHCSTGSANDWPASTTPAYSLVVGPYVQYNSGTMTHPANVNIATGIVGTGTQSCQFNANTNYNTIAGYTTVLAIFAYAP